MSRARGGSDTFGVPCGHRVSNLTLACRACNEAKGTQTAAEFGHPHLHAQARVPLKDAAAVNVTWWALYERLTTTGLPVAVGTGGRTKFNRTRQDYDKEHWIRVRDLRFDAACVGVSGEQVYIAPSHRPLSIQAVGRQNRQMTLGDKYGFPRTKGKAARFSHGFQSSDLVEACVPSGKRAGHYRGKVAIKASRSFTVAGTPDISWKHCHLIQRADGYSYAYQKGARNSLVT